MRSVDSLSEVVGGPDDDAASAMASSLATGAIAEAMQRAANPGSRASTSDAATAAVASAAARVAAGLTADAIAAAAVAVQEHASAQAAATMLDGVDAVVVAVDSGSESDGDHQGGDERQWPTTGAGWLAQLEEARTKLQQFVAALGADNDTVGHLIRVSKRSHNGAGTAAGDDASAAADAVALQVAEAMSLQILACDASRALRAAEAGGGSTPATADATRNLASSTRAFVESLDMALLLHANAVRDHAGGGGGGASSTPALLKQPSRKLLRSATRMLDAVIGNVAALNRMCVTLMTHVRGVSGAMPAKHRRRVNALLTEASQHLTSANLTRLAAVTRAMDAAASAIADGAGESQLKKAGSTGGASDDAGASAGAGAGAGAGDGGSDACGRDGEASGATRVVAHSLGSEVVRCGYWTDTGAHTLVRVLASCAMPVIITAPHGGSASHAHQSHYLEERPTRPGIAKLADGGTAELAMAIVGELGRLSGGRHPAAVIARFHRRYVDANRSLAPKQAAVAGPNGKACYDRYHAGTYAVACSLVSAWLDCLLCSSCRRSRALNSWQVSVALAASLAVYIDLTEVRPQVWRQAQRVSPSVVGHPRAS